MSDDDPKYVTATREMLRERLQDINPNRFEDFVAALWGDYLGWEDTEVVGDPGDRGIDVVATTPDGERALIQCKRYSGSVDSASIQQYADLKLQHPDVSRIVVVTTGEFTESAEELAADLDIGMELVDGEELAALIDRRRAYPLAASYLPGVKLARTVEGFGDAGGTRAGVGGLVERVRSLFGR